MQQLSRRRFLASSLTGLVAAPLCVPSAVLGRDGQLPPSDRITIGVFGVGNRGSHSIAAMRPLPDHQVLAIAEARRDRAQRALGVVNEMYAARVGMSDYKACELYADWRDVLERDDIDVIWGTTPDHWHGPMFAQIIKAGKDLYGEKSLTRYISRGVEICKLVRQYGCVFQTGTQQRSDPRFRFAAELARNGYLGKIHTIEVISPAGQDYPVIPPSDPPPGFDWEMWTGPAPMFPFDRQRVEWLAMYMISHYCAGFVTNWGVHHLDIAGWGIPEAFEQPFAIEGTGTMPTGGMTDTWMHWNAVLQYESGLKIDYCSVGRRQPRDGCRFIGDEGTVFVNRSVLEANPASLLDVKLKDSDTRLHRSPHFADPYTAHTADFFRSIRTRRAPVSPVESGHWATTLGNVTDIALHLGRKLKWDPKENRFIGDDDANRMLAVAERSPWTMEM
ncbi:MAG: Gfo/Idh/MocA family oxidoreductase [Planctomycetaceae bacterium]|nr:Gfo/Idh/MocA family oxidoreductase [Planctomycetaceae bacterium]